MSKLEETNFEDHETLIFPCACHDHHFMIIDWDDKDSDWRHLVLTVQWRPKGIWNKIKDTWKIWRNKEYISEEIFLNDNVISNLRKFLENK